MDSFDLAIIGGGVNGCGIARDAAGRGLSVLLVERDDLASATSSASTKLIHGGLRYLEYYEFRLVHEALVEREVLWRIAPHIIHALRFILPHSKGLRPAWMLRLGLFLYDHLGGRKLLPGTRTLDLRSDPAGQPLKSGFSKAFEYSDCWVDDARLVALNAVDAARHGASIRTRTLCVEAGYDGEGWHLQLENTLSGEKSEARAAVLVNSTGPWVSEFLDQRLQIQSTEKVRLVKGSHIIVPKLFEHDRAYLFQNPDQRIIFAIPYEHDYTLIGTTDQDISGAMRTPHISAGEIKYLCEAASEYFQAPILPADVVWTYSGVRPLYDDGASAAREATRDYVLSCKPGGADHPPLLSVFGGKITIYRKLAEAALEKLRDYLPPMTPAWTAHQPLPGGEFPVTDFEARYTAAAAAYPFLAPASVRRLLHAYGTRIDELLDGATSLGDLGEHFGADLYAREVNWLMNEEWAMTAEDVLWRRTKLGLRLSAGERESLAQWMAGRA